MRILLAEDEISLARAIIKILQSNNYEVDSVDNGDDAIYYLLSDNYDIAIIDIMLNGLDGITVVKEVREKGCDAAIIMLTALSDIDKKVEALDLGANDYLTKPFSAKELLARLRSITRGTNSIDSKVSLGNTVLDRTNFQLSTPYDTITLANKEYQMMEMFMLSYGKLISSDRLMDRIWGLDSDADISIVWVYISYLRKKLTKLKSNLVIKSNRNAGYYLEVEDDQKD
ncbi:MAG: response regulator transcription factor [Erysipelotrichaceae bacterium]